MESIFLLLILFSFASAQNIGCHIRGQCTGEFIGFTTADDYNSCLQTCQVDDGCNAFTFNEDGNVCLKHSRCGDVSASCATCYSGDKDCEPEVEKHCGDPGFCQGSVVAYDTAASASACQILCLRHNGCEFYSFFANSSTCFMNEDCTLIDQSCSDCTYGERSCYQATSYGKLFAVGGSDEFDFTSEVVDLTSASTNCPAIAGFPGARESSVGTFIGNRAIVCGGWNNGDVFNTKRECFFYDPSTNSWIETVSMTSRRSGSAGVHLSADQWWVSGGYTGEDEDATSEVYNVGLAFEQFLDIPAIVGGHNLIQIDPTHFMMTGDDERTHMFDSGAGAWTELPAMAENRHLSFSGLVTYPDGTEVVIVAGGGGIGQNTTEILDLETMTWSYGPPLPVRNVDSGASVPFGDTFLIVGGWSEEQSIFFFDPEAEDWVKMEQTLELGRNDFAAFLVPDDFITCN